MVFLVSVTFYQRLFNKNRKAELVEVIQCLKLVRQKVNLNVLFIFYALCNRGCTVLFPVLPF